MKTRLLAGCALALLAGGCALPPTEYREPPPLSVTQRIGFNLRVYDAAWQKVNTRYFDAKFRGVDWAAAGARHRPAAVAATDDQALYRAINQLCAELKESHLLALPPRSVHEIDTGHRVAVGMTWTIVEGRRVVTEVLPGGPADQAGVRPGWILLTRDGQPLNDDGPAYITHLDRTVAYGFLDTHDEARTLTLKPALLKFERLIARDLPGEIRYLRFDRFGRESLHWLSSELKEHREAPAVIVDLRRNPGGNALAVMATIEEFFDHRVPAGEFIRRDGGAREKFGLSLLSARYPGRVVILTGPASASAAEIFTHVLRHLQRATVVGRATAGAVIVAQYYPLPGGGEIQVPVQDYVGLDGHRLEGRGVAPDITVPAPSLADLRTGRDRDLEAAQDALARGTSAVR